MDEPPQEIPDWAPEAFKNKAVDAAARCLETKVYISTNVYDLVFQYDLATEMWVAIRADKRK
jgi:hypothetical protein